MSLPSDPPPYTRVVRDLALGMHAYTALLPGALDSPGLERVCADPSRRRALVAGARVNIVAEPWLAWVDESVPCIMLGAEYYREASALDLYLDLLHELTHVRQHQDGEDIWDESKPYVRRPTEIEAYAVAVGEARRLGLGEAQIVEHLSNPWMSEAEVRELFVAVERRLAG